MRPDTTSRSEEAARDHERIRGRDEWIDTRPTRAELEADERGPDCPPSATRPDPWCDLPVTPREWPPIPTEPPF